MYKVLKGLGSQLQENPYKIEYDELELAVVAPKTSPVQDGQPLEDFSEQSSNEENASDLSLDEFNQKAEKIIETAKKRAMNMVEDASAEAGRQRERILNEASEELAAMRAKEKEIGYIEGVTLKREEIEKAIKDLSDIVQTFRIQSEQTNDELKKKITDMVVAATEKIIHKKLEQDPLVLLPIIQDAMSNLSSKNKPILSVSHRATELVDYLKKQLKTASSTDDMMFELVAKDMPIDFCLLESGDEVLDLSILDQLQNLKRFFELNQSGG